MPNWIIKEGMFDKFIDSIFNRMKKKRIDSFIKDTHKKDPELAQAIQDFNDSYEVLKRWEEKHK